MNCLHDKVAIVTGATGGIGRAIAERLTMAGCCVIINSSKSVSSGEEIASQLENAFYLQANVSDEVECKMLLEKAYGHWGRLDIVINNAAPSSDFIPHSDFEAVTDEMFRKNFEVNVMGAWYLSRAAFPYLEKSEDGVIVNVSSVAGTRPSGSSIPYAVSKAALDHLTRLLAKAMGPKVRVNGIAPGYIDTERTRVPAAKSLCDKLMELAPLGRPGEAKEIAEAVLGIVNCHFMTGSIVTVDGGASLV